MGRSKGPDKNRDAEGMLTREGIATNKATAAANKATTILKIKKRNLKTNYNN